MDQERPARKQSFSFRKQILLERKQQSPHYYSAKSRRFGQLYLQRRERKLNILEQDNNFASQPT